MGGYGRTGKGRRTRIRSDGGEDGECLQHLLVPLPATLLPLLLLPPTRCPSSFDLRTHACSLTLTSPLQVSSLPRLHPPAPTLPVLMTPEDSRQDVELIEKGVDADAMAGEACCRGR
eukprot:759081-Hanusia_phi.AAC.1